MFEENKITAELTIEDWQGIIGILELMSKDATVFHFAGDSYTGGWSLIGNNELLYGDAENPDRLMDVKVKLHCNTLAAKLKEQINPKLIELDS